MRFRRATQVWNQLAGHGWTVLPTLRHDLARRAAPVAVRWQTEIEDVLVGRVTLSGMYRREPDARGLVVVLHGLGGNVHRSYCVAAARAAAAEGLSCLRLSMRGADDVGCDIHHAGLTADVAAVLADARFAHYEDIYLMGYSLGGHVALRGAVDLVSERLRAVAAICPPIELRGVQQALDRPACAIYRHYILKGLKDMYRGIAARGPVPTPVERMEQVQTLREWDALTVVPRFGFASVDDYYRQESVASRIGNLQVRTLVVASPQDPMIPADGLKEVLPKAGSGLEVRWVEGGGHVFFSPRVELGLTYGPAGTGIERQIMRWLVGAVNTSGDPAQAEGEQDE